MTVTDANGLAPIPATGRTRPEMIPLDAMIIGVAGHFDLHRRRVVGLGGEVTMVNPIAAPIEVQLELVVAADHGAFGEAARRAHHFYARSGGGGIGEKQPLHHDMFALDEHGGVSREHHLARRFGSVNNRPLRFAVSAQCKVLVRPSPIPQDNGVSWPNAPAKPGEVRTGGDAVLSA